MQASEIEREPPIDEHPKIIIAHKRKCFPSDVDKLRRHFEREVKVVVTPLIAKALAIDRKKCSIRVNEKPLLRSRIEQLEGNRQRCVDPGNITIPGIEVGLSTGSWGARPGRVHGLIIRAKHGFQHPLVAVARVEAFERDLEVRVSVPKIANSRSELGRLGGRRIAREKLAIHAAFNTITASADAGRFNRWDRASRLPSPMLALLRAVPADVSTRTFGDRHFAPLPNPNRASLDTRPARVAAGACDTRHFAVVPVSPLATLFPVATRILAGPLFTRLLTGLGQRETGSGPAARWRQ